MLKLLIEREGFDIIIVKIRLISSLGGQNHEENYMWRM